MITLLSFSSHIGLAKQQYDLQKNSLNYSFKGLQIQERHSEIFYIIKFC